MIDTDFLKDFAFSDPVRRLHQTSDNNTISDAASYEHAPNVIGIYLTGVIMVVIVAVACFRIVRVLLSAGSVDEVDAPELPSDNKEQRKSTLAQRKRAILEIFETSQVTMVSNDPMMMDDGKASQKEIYVNGNAHHIYILICSESNI